MLNSLELELVEIRNTLKSISPKLSLYTELKKKEAELLKKIDPPEEPPPITPSVHCGQNFEQFYGKRFYSPKQHRHITRMYQNKTALRS